MIPDVSIIIPTYNRRDLIVRAINSCKSKSQSVEVLVIDDGSRDDIKAVILTQYGAAKEQSNSDRGIALGNEQFCIRYYYKENGGAPSARNLGLTLARGVFIKFLDSDDELISTSLSKEVLCANQTGADVVVSGWIERNISISNRGNFQQDIRRKVPIMTAGIDDMLLGIAPWTSAALYRRSIIAPLRWNEDTLKAQEWDWAWTVCLAGASFESLDIVSAIYHHHDGARITAQENAFLNSTIWRQKILGRVEEKLIATGRMDKSRAQALVQYYYKDARVLCEFRPDDWRALCKKFNLLAPGFLPADPQWLARTLNRCIGIHFGVRLLVFLRRLSRSLIGKKPFF